MNLPFLKKFKINSIFTLFNFYKKYPNDIHQKFIININNPNEVLFIKKSFKGN